MRQIRILHLIDSGGIYGAEIMLLNLIREQTKQDSIPILGSFRRSGEGPREIEKRAGDLGIEVKIFPATKGINLNTGMKIIKWSSSAGIDIIHSHGFKPNLLIGFYPSFIRKKALFRTLHGWTSTKIFTKIGLYQLLDLLSLKNCDALFAVSEAMKQHRFLKNTTLKIEVIPNGIRNPSEEIGKPVDSEDPIVKFSHEEVSLLSIGRLSEEKGFDLLIRAIAYLRKRGVKCNLCIIGEGPQQKSLEHIIRQLDLQDAVLLSGYRNDAFRFIPLFHMYVLSSHTEGLPITVLEAMHMGIPIAATRVGGVPEVLENGDAGFLFSSNEPKTIASELAAIISDQNRRDQIVTKAKSLAAEKYSAVIMASKYENAYRRKVGF